MTSKRHPGASAPRAVVVGAGITGLVAARELSLTGRDVIVLEAADRVGGKLARTSFTGADPATELSLDVGAESMLARRPEGVALIEELGLEALRASPTPAKPQALVGGRVRALPASLLGVPTDLDALSGYLSEQALDRARREPDLPAPALPGDVGIGSYVAERFGDEVTERLLEPLLGGVYAGRSRELSFAAVNPALFARARDGGSLLQAAQSLVAHAPATTVPLFAGIAGGITTLVEALVEDLARRGVELRLGTTVRGLEPAGPGFRLVSGSVPAPVPCQADEVVLAVPAAPAGRLLDGLAPDAGAALAGIPYASTAVITLLVHGAELSGSGLLVPPGELPTVKALTYADRKWPWVADAAERWAGAPIGVVRASVGRFGEAALLQLPDGQLLDRTFEELRSRVPGWARAELRQGRVQRWGGGLPQYLVGHVERVATVLEQVAAVPGLAVAGAYLHGVGLPACIASGRSAAAAITQR